MDALDYKVLERLCEEGRITWAELASVLKLSAASTGERVKRLEEKGVIKGYRAVLDYEALGYGITAFISVSLAHPRDREALLHWIRRASEVEECHHLAGEDDYVLKVRVKNMRRLEEMVSEEIKSLGGILRTKTQIALSTVKEGIVKL